MAPGVASARRVHRIVCVRHDGHTLSLHPEDIRPCTIESTSPTSGPPALLSTRAVQLLLHYVPANKEQWSAVLSERRSRYVSLCQELMLDRSRLSTTVAGGGGKAPQVCVDVGASWCLLVGGASWCIWVGSASWFLGMRLLEVSILGPDRLGGR
eukprot:249621-Chlamydomonas_euryale.AAC.1